MVLVVILSSGASLSISSEITVTNPALNTRKLDVIQEVLCKAPGGIQMR